MVNTFYETENLMLWGMTKCDFIGLFIFSLIVVADEMNITIWMKHTDFFFQ